jgi:sugar lactone lactonase YvrE
MPNWVIITPSPNLLGESPFWHPTEKMLYWIDIPARLICRTRVKSKVVESWQMHEEPGCIAPRTTPNGLVIALRDGIYTSNAWQGKLTKISDVNFDTTTTRFNDGKCDSQGRFWAGTLFEPRTARLAKLYCLDARTTQLATMQDNAILANGLAWSPDDRTVYWADTTDHVIRAWDWDRKTGHMENPRIFAQFPTKPTNWHMNSGIPYAGRPDGCAVDVEGNYYIAMFEGQQILKIAPNGNVLDSIPTPSRCTTMPCFGGDDLKTLFITTASYNRPSEEVSTYPLSGHVFSLQMAVAGLPVNHFAG